MFPLFRKKGSPFGEDNVVKDNNRKREGTIKLIQENNFQHKKENYEKKQEKDFIKKGKSQIGKKNGKGERRKQI